MKESVFSREKGGSFKMPETVLVAGATGGIGKALIEAVARQYPGASLIRLARDPTRLIELNIPTIDLQFDLLNESSISQAIDQITPGSIDLAFVATGFLHDHHYKPEKTFKSLTSDHLLHSYQLNAIGPALLCKHLIPRMNDQQISRIGILSARVGSISDNRLGGWHAYRSSKAALNMLIKNYAIEMGYKRRQLIVVGLQPGTTDTQLSAPFQANVPDGQLQTTQFTADQLLQVMSCLKLEDSGKLFDFMGLPFEP
ncbi:MAG: SDR family NAD(P)-dependent oxidoreductase [Candidatus Thiodiazotropha weberae]|nr:SDR family NAD(P)-dependent oxidoreductase [Candidatus Thiodiazotropha weberae]MCG7916068.1 SDR family NAD(P)-dependent oxidoreductase [Candidatus Thiodiazotropha weberae]